MYFSSLFAAVLVSVVPHLTSAAPASAPVNEVHGLAKRYVLDDHMSYRDLRSRPAEADSAFPSRYAPGSCGVHVTQHQKPNPATDSYTFDILVKDANGVEIGGSAGVVGATGQTINQYSQLPYVLLITAGGIDSDPVSFAYAASHWDSHNGCSTEAYDSRSQQINCSFPC